MARTPNYDLSKQPQWVQSLITDLGNEKADLYNEVERLESIVATLEGLFERAAIQELDGLPVDNTVGVTYLEAHDEATCPTADCPDRITGTHGM